MCLTGRYHLQSVRALVESLGDQYSRFLPVEAMQSFQMHLEGESYGRGVISIVLSLSGASYNCKSFSVGIDIDQISARDPGRLFPHLKFEHLLKAAIATSMRSISFDLYRMTLLAWFTAAIFLAAISFFGVSKLVYVGVVPLLLLPVLTLLNVSMFVITGINGGSMNKFDASNETTPFGLEIGDIILSVNGSAVSRCDPSSLRRILDGGESGEAIDISVLRLKDAASWGIGKFFKTINISVIKRIAYDPSVNSFKNKNGVTVLQIRRFQESTPQEVVEALGMNDSPSRSWIDRLTCIENIKSNNTAVVIDLRGNTGGDLFAAIDSASLFLPFGRVISHIYSKPLSNEGEGQPMLRWARYFHFWLSSVRNYNMMTDLKSPLLVLVDNHTASAAEILAWALHDHGRACTWGEKTYGKSIAQVYLNVGSYYAAVNAVPFII